MRRATPQSKEAKVLRFFLLNNTAGTLRCLDRLDEAADLFTRGPAGFRDIGDRRGETAGLSNLSIADRRQGRYAASRDRMMQALDL